MLRHAVRVLTLIVSVVPACFNSPADVHAGDLTSKDRTPLPGTKPLTLEGDVASHLVDAADRFLLYEIEKSVAAREKHWNRDLSSAAAYEKSIEPNRKRLAHILGVRDARVPFDAPELLSTTKRTALVGRGDGYEVHAVRWPVLADPDPIRDNVVVYGEGLLLTPTGRERVADVVAIPDADQTPEQIAGLTEGVAVGSQYARRLAESGCRVLVPVLMSREMKPRTRPGSSGGATMTNREYVYRAAFELGRHVIGYELQKVLAGVDWFEKEAGRDAKIGVVGYGEGGLIAMFAGALDPRIDAVCVSGAFGSRQQGWHEPLDRNVFGLLREFGDAELASMIAPRSLVIDGSPGPELALPGKGGGAPAELKWPPPEVIQRESDRFAKYVGNLKQKSGDSALANVAFALEGEDDFLNTRILLPFAGALVENNFAAGGVRDSGKKPIVEVELPDPEIRQTRQLNELDQFNQLLLRESPFVRKEFMNKLETSSVEAYGKSVEPYRDIFRKDVIGEFDNKPLPFNPRTRKSWETDKWTAYEVVLDLWPIGDQTPGVSKRPGVSNGPKIDTVFCYGVLILPKDLKTDGSEKRPVVVCQHGLEGRPTDVFLGDHRAYHDFAAKLAERGFITFAPQNLYIFKDRFRTLQRKANPLGKTLFSIITPQHQQIVDWLQSLDYVDPDRVAFYGLSYGGKTAMRVPALVTDYCLSICSADFNEWVRKNASTRHPFSYMWTGEYEIFEFDLGSTFNYAEMAALICPRPFMVERGHFDGVGWDEWVGYEFGKVRHLYQAKLRIGDRCELEWFVGPHTINGQGTYAFLHKHLNWPESKR